MTKILTMCAAMWMLCGTVFAQAPATGKNFSVSLPLPMTYQWKKNGTAISGATSANYKINSVKSGDAGSYTVTVSNSAGSVTSSAAKLTVNLKAPTISTQPKSQTIAEGKSVTFSVTATGSELKYQWKKGGTAISGATSSSYTISSVKPGDAGSYTVTVSNSAGNVTSSAAVLTVTAKPTISTQPKSQTVTEGNAVTFSVMATGTGTLSYQWKKDGTAISGATSASYTISSAKRSDAGSYTVTVSNSAGSVTSSAAKLTVNLKAPTISTQPKSQTVKEGSSVTFSVSATGSGTLSYQWKKDGTAISGATGTSYKISSVKGSDAGSYTVTVSNSIGNLTSDEAVLTVITKPVIISFTKDLSVTEGNRAVFSVTATGGNLNYQWYKDNIAISGATAATYTIESTATSDAGSRYKVTVSNVMGSVTSDLMTLTVNIRPTITVQPEDQTVGPRSNVTLSVTATGTAPLSYQWYKDNKTIAGATSSSYTISNTTGSDTGTYMVKVSNAAGYVNSKSVKLTVKLGEAISSIYKRGKYAKVILHTAPVNTDNSYFVEDILPPLSNTLSYDITLFMTNSSVIPLDLTNIYSMAITNSYGGYYSATNHAIRWYFFDAQPRDIQYVVKVPWNCYKKMDLNGKVTFTEIEKDVTGDRSIDFNEKLHPADLNDYMDISTQEIASYCMSWKQFRNWSRPAPATGSTVIGTPYAARGVQIWLHGSDYLYKSEKVEPNCWIAGVIKPGGSGSGNIGVPVIIPIEQFNVASQELTEMEPDVPENLVVRAASEGDSTSTRTIRKNGNTATVSLSLRPDPEVILYFVEEIVPVMEGIEISDISNGGVYIKEKGTLRWAFMEGTPHDLSYTITLPNDYTGTVTLTGSTTFNTTEVQTTGDSVISDVTAPAITAQPKSQTVNEGSSVTFSVTATGTAPLSYQWKKNGTAISGATKSSYTISSAKSSDEGSYTVTVSNSAGNVTSSAATLTVKTEPPPTGLSVRRSVSVTGNKATVTLTISNAPKGYFGSLEETWQRKDITFSGISNGGTAAEAENGMKVSWSGFDMSGNYQIPGTLTYTASVPEGTSATVALSGQLMITTPDGTVSADIDTVNVTFTAAPSAPVITTQPKSQTVSEGGSVTLSVTATGSAPLIYQWFKNNSLLSGANGSSYTIPSASTSDAGTYMVMVTNAQGAVMSTPVILTVTQGGVPELSLTQTSGGKWKITFTGTLQESTDMKSWKNVSGTQNGAYTFTPAKGKKFYRAVK